MGTARRRFLQTTALGLTAAAVQSAGAQGASIIDCHAHWVADRLLFGTDSGPVASIGPTIASVKQADLTADQRSMIFSGNARRLLAAKGVSV